VGQRPDLIVLDLRLPKRSGLEVCDALCGDPEDPSVPIILVSAAAETDARLQAFARGVDDYLTKPFSPKELIARIKRHLSRSGEARLARSRALDLEREIGRAQAEAARAADRCRREIALRELSSVAGRDFLRVFDRELLGRRLLDAVRTRTGAGAVVLLLPGPEGALLPAVVRGADPASVAGLALRQGGELARFLAAIERPVVRAELERVPELAFDLAPFVHGGFTLLIPLRAGVVLQGVLAVADRADGASPGRAEMEAVAGLTESAAVAFENCERFRSQTRALLDLAIENAGVAPDPLAEEMAVLVERAGRASGLPLGMLETAAEAVRVLHRLPDPELQPVLDRLSVGDASGWILGLSRLTARVRQPVMADDTRDPEARRAELLVRVGRHYGERRGCGAGGAEALASAIERYRDALDPITRQALGQVLPRP
jgi:CheY-like chemotaxis protein